VTKAQDRTAVNPTLWDAVLGAWELVSFTARDETTGEDRQPLGTAPRGLILYTADGHMSAQLAKSDMSGYAAYGGRGDVDAAPRRDRVDDAGIVGATAVSAR
jgi:Lipocalin-like domain